jgi:hypothetical protein
LSGFYSIEEAIFMKRKNEKRKRRSIRLRDLNLYHVRRRFPRLEDHDHLDREIGDIDLIAKLKSEYPPKIESNPNETNFLERSLSQLISSKTGALREKSEMHGLSAEGTRSELLMRLYLHYRSTFSLSTSRSNGSAIPAYGPGYEQDCDPGCVWGKLWLNNQIRIRREWKTMKRFPRKPIVQRFPRMIRFLRRIRFPRLQSFNGIPDLIRDPALLRKMLG